MRSHWISASLLLQFTASSDSREGRRGKIREQGVWYPCWRSPELCDSFHTRLTSSAICQQGPNAAAVKQKKEPNRAWLSRRCDSSSWAPCRYSANSIWPWAKLFQVNVYLTLPEHRLSSPWEREKKTHTHTHIPTATHNNTAILSTGSKLFMHIPAQHDNSRCS